MSLSHIPRSRNGRADTLAKEARNKGYIFSHIDQTRIDGGAPRRIGSINTYIHTHLISLSNNKHISLIIFVLNTRNFVRENGGKSVHGDGLGDDGMCFTSMRCTL